MPTSYKLKPGVDMAFIGGAGRVDEGQVLRGSQFAKYVPGLLVEVPDAPASASSTPSAPKPLTEPSPSLEEETKEDRKQLTEAKPAIKPAAGRGRPSSK